MDIKETHTERGFKLIKFKDRYDNKCEIQKSSLATEDAIWFGLESASPKIMASKVTPGATGWVKYDIPDDVLLSTRMHLTREQVKELIPILQTFVDTGELNGLGLEPKEKNVTGKELYNLLKKGIKPTLICTKTITDLNTQFEEKMLVDLIDIKIIDDEFIELTVDESNYKKFNKKLEVPDYWNEEAEAFDKKYSELYERKNKVKIIDSLDELVNFTIKKDGYADLQKQFIDSNSDLSYIDWLQEEVSKLKES